MQKKITSKVENFIKLVIYGLIPLEKANLVCYKSIKQSTKTTKTDAIAKIKQPRLDKKAAQTAKSIVVSTPLFRLNMQATFDNVFNLK